MKRQLASSLKIEQITDVYAPILEGKSIINKPRDSKNMVQLMAIKDQKPEILVGLSLVDYYKNS